MTREQQIAKIKEGFTPPFRYCFESTSIEDANGDLALQCRGLSGLRKRVPHNRINHIQDALGGLITDLLNETITP